MPTISTFFGIIITMYFKEHNPPHFHAAYGDAEGVYTINPIGLQKGKLPRRADALVREWAVEHQAELLENWNRMRRSETPGSIDPLT